MRIITFTEDQARALDEYLLLTEDTRKRENAVWERYLEISEADEILHIKALRVLRRMKNTEEAANALRQQLKRRK